MVVSEKVALKRLVSPLVKGWGCSEGLVTLALHTLGHWVDGSGPDHRDCYVLMPACHYVQVLYAGCRRWWCQKRWC